MPRIRFHGLAAKIEVAGDGEVVAQTNGLLDRLDSLIDRELGMEFRDRLPSK